jgi:4-hydroxy-tetrahydrodipicolinate reductase
MKPLRVVQVGLGPIGCEIARLAASRPGLECVGAVDPKPGIAGRDLGTLLGRDPLGIVVEKEIAPAIERTKPDVVFHSTASFLADVAKELLESLRTGSSVISTCEELAYPFHRHPELAKTLDRAASVAGGVLLGTGVNPGFVMDKLVATLMGACRTVEHVTVRRVVDASTRREPLQRKVGAGLSQEAFEAIAGTGRLGHVGLVESAQMLADVLTLPAAREVTESVRPKLARQPIATEYLRVEAGQVAGIEHDVAVLAQGRERILLELRMYVGATEPGDTIAIEGAPPIHVSIANGVHGDVATASIVVNSAHSIGALTPGLRTMLDVPLRFFGAIG